MTPAPAAIPVNVPPPPQALAIRSLLVLGAACTLFGLTFVIAFGVFNSFERFRPWFITMGLLLWIGPGISYLSCVYWMRRDRRGATTTALATVIVQALGAAALLAAAATFDPVTPLPIVLCVMWLAALADCARQVVRARRFLPSRADRVRGFEPVLGAPGPGITANNPFGSHARAERGG